MTMKVQSPRYLLYLDNNECQTTQGRRCTRERKVKSCFVFLHLTLDFMVLVFVLRQWLRVFVAIHHRRLSGRLVLSKAISGVNCPTRNFLPAVAWEMGNWEGPLENARLYLLGFFFFVARGVPPRGAKSAT